MMERSETYKAADWKMARLESLYSTTTTATKSATGEDKEVFRPS